MSLYVFALPFVQMAQSKGPPHLRDYIIIIMSSVQSQLNLCRNKPTDLILPATGALIFM